ncbi:MAG: Imm21 family immunity protein [Myxococcaceae bacterium]
MATKRKASKQFGDYYWATGPIFIGSKKLADAAKARDPKLLDALKKEKKAPALKKVLGEQVVLFGGDNKPSKWLQEADGGVLVRVAKHVPHQRLDDVLAMVPEQVGADAWKRGVLKFKLSGDAQRFFIDPWSNNPAKPIPAPIAVSLAAGEWELDQGLAGKEPLVAQFTVFRKKGALAAVPSGPTKAVPTRPEVSLEAATKKAAKALRFVGTEGGPVMAIPVSALESWKGVFDANGEALYGKGPTDYDRACDVKGPILKHGGVEVLVLDQESTAFFKASDEVSYFLRWIGADHGSHVLQAVLSAGPKAWKFTGKTFTVAGEGGLAVIDSAEFGRDVKKPAIADLKPGRYQLDEMTEFNGEVIDGATRHEVMASALRLRRLA